MTSKRRKGFNSETNVKRGYRSVKAGEKELVEKLGRRDPCPCGSGKSFQEMLPQIGALSTGPIATNTGANEALCSQKRLS
ncbi:MAG: SEC-C metal-binding domain-containing protein [Pseudomonadota bacterium]